MLMAWTCDNRVQDSNVKAPSIPMQDYCSTARPLHETPDRSGAEIALSDAKGTSRVSAAIASRGLGVEDGL